MEVTDITFNIKDVITIAIGITSFTGFYYALKRSVDKVSNDLDTLESKHKTDTDAIMETLRQHKKDLHTSEEHIYIRISEIREEQKAANDKLESKIDAMAGNLLTMSNCMSELTGYIKAKK